MAVDINAAFDAVESSRKYVKNHFRGALTRLAKRIDIDDLMQEITIEVVKDFDKCRAGTPEELNGWVRQIARTTTLEQIDYHKRQRRSIDVENALPDSFDAPCKSTHEEQVENTDQCRSLLEPWIGYLTASHAKVLRLRFFDLIPDADAATEMGVSVSAYRCLLRMAIQSLKKFVESGARLLPLSD